jgi:ABC-type antimicrobial peptide transport system permease subunit
MALGATGQHLLRCFLRDGGVMVAVRIASGTIAAIAAGRSLASLVFGVTVNDPATLATIAAFLTAVALLACYRAVRSATRVDPWEALRLE